MTARLDRWGLRGLLASREIVTRRIVRGTALCLAGATAFGLGVVTSGGGMISLGGWLVAAVGLTLVGTASVPLFRYGHRYPAVVFAGVAGLGLSALLLGMGILAALAGVPTLPLGSLPLFATVAFGVLLVFLMIGALARWLGG